jgi:hypothetical protein
MQHRGPRWGAIAALVTLTFLLMPLSASAHERRDLTGGKYRFVVGFLNEPAVESFQNGIDLTVTDMSQKDANGNGKAVEGLEKTLKAEVLFGGSAKRDVALETRFGMPGKYAGYFVPTAAGQYRFHIFGTVNEQKVDETFESGPGRFNDVQALSSLQFPNQVSVPANAQQQIDSAKSAANAGRALGITGLAVGILGLAAAGLALARRPAARPVAATERTDTAGT